MRKALFSAALVASQCDPVFSAFYQKKVSEGKHHLTALGAVSRKLCYVIHAILTKNEPYIIVSEHSKKLMVRSLFVVPFFRNYLL